MPNAYSTKAADIATHAPQVETLLLGASHVLMGVRPDLLATKAYNLAHVSQTLDIDCDLLQTYLPTLPRLKTVVTCVDAAILFDPPLAEGEENFRCTYYNLYLPTPRYGQWPQFCLETASYTSVKNKICALFNSDTSPHIDTHGWYDGYTPNKQNAVERTAPAAHDRVKKHCKYGRNYLNSNRNALHRLHALCRRHDLKLVLIATPTTSHYAEALPAWATKAVHETFSMFKNTDDVLLRDYSRDMRFSADNFFDTDHLNTKGATKFTRILREEIGL